MNTDTPLKAPLQDLARHRSLAESRSTSGGIGESWLFGLISRRVGGRMGTAAGIAGVIGAVGLTAWFFYRYAPQFRRRHDDDYSSAA